MEKNFKPIIIIAIVFFLLGGLVLLAVMRIGQPSPIAPTAPTGQKAFEGSPVPACIVNFQISPPSPSPSPSSSPSASPLSCSLQVCKAIKAAGVGLADWSLVPTATFSVELGQNPDLSAPPIRAITYGTPWQTINFYNTDQPNATLGEIPAVCKPVPPLNIDIFPPDNVHLTYKEEVIQTSGVPWDPPLYNDSNTAPILTFDQFQPYTDILFDGDLSNDEGRDTNADGDINLRENNCNRTLAILNQYPLPAATPNPTPSPSATPSVSPSASPVPSATPTAQCQALYAYRLVNGVWTRLTGDELKLVPPGETIRFAVLGSTDMTNPDFDRAHFRINGVPPTWQETTSTFIDNGNQYFYIDYTLLPGTTSYTVESEIHSVSLGWL